MSQSEENKVAEVVAPDAAPVESASAAETPQSKITRRDLLLKAPKLR
jgi:hypothetical protein